MTILVVIDPSEAGERLLQRAADQALGVETDLVLLSVLDESEFEADMETIEAIGDVENAQYGEETVLGAAEQATEELAMRLVPESISWDTEELVIDDGDRAKSIIAVAEEHDCDHVFVLGKRRSPTGKAMFGDATQSVLLNFDGYVTVAMKSD